MNKYSVALKVREVKETLGTNIFFIEDTIRDLKKLGYITTPEYLEEHSDEYLEILMISTYVSKGNPVDHKLKVNRRKK